MDELYDDLTNYEDVNALEELRTENKELKEMLDQRTAAMENLQKEILQDYDTLELEFKKLEHNYSSLLKTARSEIERKTQWINQINTEKDMMVLDAIKSGKRIRRNFSKGQTKYQVVPGKGNNKNKEDSTQQKNVDIKPERREAPVLQPKQEMLEFGASNRNKSDNTGTNIELSSTGKSSVNEKTVQRKTELNEPPKAPPASIRDRRKSMPVVSMPTDTFSSDDELERSRQTKDTRTDHIQSDYERRNISKMPVDRYNKITSETSSVSDRQHFNHDPTSRNGNYRGRSNRQHDSGSYRGRNKYEVSLKYRKQYSPERGQKRQHREYDDYHRYERETYKGRSRESPEHSRYNRRKSEQQSDYDRYSHEYEKNRHHYDDKYSASKYRSKNYDEPNVKRQRTESYGSHNAHFQEAKKHQHEREPVNEQPSPAFSHEYDMLRYSCQSPDVEHNDSGRESPKEIMAIADTPLEDPRVTSKRYVIWKENGKETLSTAVGRNIDIKPVNKNAWNIKHMVPVALVRRPSQCSDQLSKDIYMDIDNSVSNLDFSMESGEVRETDEEMHEIRRKPKEIEHNTQDFKKSKLVANDLLIKGTDVKKVPITDIAGHQSTKIEQNKKSSHSKMDVPFIDLDENLSRKNESSKRVASDSFSKELLAHKQQYSGREDQAHKEDALLSTQNDSQIEHIKKATPKETAVNWRTATFSTLKQHNQPEECLNVKDYHPDNKNYSKIENNKTPTSKVREDSFRRGLTSHKHQYNKEREERMNVKDSLDNKKISKIESSKEPSSRESIENHNQATLTKIAIVADDLELSDDNSDHIDINKSIAPPKLQTNSETPINMNDFKMNKSGNNADDKTLNSSHNTEKERTVDTPETTDATEDEKFKESESTKKQKSKKKKRKSKDVSKDVDSIAPDKKPRSKKEKEDAPQETKEKFSDLFGDSSSLMTPEDLGIPSYLPISEDAQDAVDMKINQIIDAAPLIDKVEIPKDIQTQYRVEVKIQDTEAHNGNSKADKQKCSTDEGNKENVVEIKKNSLKKNEENIIEPSQLPSPIVYENVNPGTDLNDPNVVKTVIISTGKQPEIAYDNSVEVKKPTAAPEVNAIQSNEDIHLFTATKEYKSDLLKALATSTPHKEFSAVNQPLPEAAKTDVICDPRLSKAVATITCAEPAVNQTETSTLEPNDAPDVRIFVKRRRKAVKRPPMT